MKARGGRLSARVVVNLGGFALLALVLTFWAFTNVISLEAIDRPYKVTAEFTTSPGLSPHFEVTYLGQRIGSIAKVQLRTGMVETDLHIDRGISIPRAVDAAVRRKSAVGEPYVDLSPIPGTDPDTGPRLAGGDRITLDHTSTPLSYASLFAAVDSLVRAVRPEDLHTVVHELAVALDGRSDSLRTLLGSTDQLTADLAARRDLLAATVADVSTLTHVLATHIGSLDASIDNLAALSATFRTSTADLTALLERGPGLGDLLAEVVHNSAGSLGCTLDSLGAVSTRLDGPTIRALADVIHQSPQFAFVLRGLMAPDKGIGGSLFFSNGTPPVPVYATPRTPPVTPERRFCTAGRNPVLATPGLGATAAPGQTAPATPGGSTPAGPDHAVRPTTPAAGSSTSDAGGSSFLDALLGWLVPLVLLVLVATGVRWWMARRRRAEEPSVPS